MPRDVNSPSSLVAPSQRYGERAPREQLQGAIPLRRPQPQQAPTPAGQPSSPRGEASGFPGVSPSLLSHLRPEQAEALWEATQWGRYASMPGASADVMAMAQRTAAEVREMLGLISQGVGNVDAAGNQPQQ